MQIWMLNHNLKEEGTWYRAWNFARQLARAGHDVTLFTVSPRRCLFGRRSMVEGVTIRETPYLGLRRLAASGLDGWDIVWRLSHILAGHWDLLFAFSSLPNVGISFLVAQAVRRRRHFLSDWDDLFSDGGIYEYLNRGWKKIIYRMERYLEYTVRKRADGVTVTSQYLLEKAGALRTDGRVAYVPTGATIADIPVLNKRDARRKLQLPDGHVMVTHLSGGFNEDGLLLLDAFKEAVDRCSDLRLLFIGTPDARYLEAVKRNGISDRVTMVGRIPFQDVPLYLGAADILSMPMHDSANSRARGPIKLRDYLCAGRPIVGTALGEVEYWMRTYSVGLLADQPAESFGRCLAELASDPVRREAMGREARRVAEQELSWDVIGQSLAARVIEWCE